MEPLTASLPSTVVTVVAIGLGATAVMDAWLLLLARLGVPVSGFALVGRWVGHLARGRYAHAAIGRAAPVRGERWLGWATHYAVGLAYAAAWVAVAGPGWVDAPRLVPALLFGLATVVVPWFVMQPAMGAGLAGAKTATPTLGRLRSLLNHAAFGAGLYLAALLLARIARP